MRWIVVVALVAGCSSKTRTADAAIDAPIDAAIDAAIDAPPDPCLQCRSDQLCVERYNGTCGPSLQCVAKTTDCPNNVCSSTCEAAYCPFPYQCGIRTPCGGESPLAFTCYGP